MHVLALQSKVSITSLQHRGQRRGRGKGKSVHLEPPKLPFGGFLKTPLCIFGSPSTSYQVWLEPQTSRVLHGLLHADAHKSVHALYLSG
eukprot:jgi/Botrbrau1/12441/Bobra.0094s0010.1